MEEHLSELVALAELRAADVMEIDFVAVAEHESLAAAVGLLVRAGCQFLPVVRGRRLVGMLDERAVSAYHDCVTSGDAPVVAHARTGSAVHADTPLAEVVAAVRQVPTEATAVVDDAGTLLGLITTARLAALLDAATRRVVSPPG
jgi:CBS-domain-containing membrane protein